MMRKHSVLNISAAFVACVVMMGCKPSVQQQWGTSETSTTDAAETTDSVGIEDSVGSENSAPEHLTLAKTFELVEPGKNMEPSAIEQLFASMRLPMLFSEQYISDADWGGDSPAISYCFGNNVKYENYNLSATGENYYGVHTNFFFDESRKTGFVNRFAIITSDSIWHARLLEDAAAAGLKFKENVDPKVYGKMGKLFQKPATQGEGVSENANYYIFDFSKSGHFDVEVGYDTGIDI